MVEIQEAWEDLANAIILSAVRDYKAALVRAAKNPKSRSARMTAMNLERFFHSEWYECLTNLEGDYLVRKMKESINEKYGQSAVK